MAAKARPPEGSDWLERHPECGPFSCSLARGRQRVGGPWPGPDWMALQRQLFCALSTVPGTPSFPYKEITHTKAFVCGADFTEDLETKGVYIAKYKKLKVEYQTSMSSKTRFSPAGLQPSAKVRAHHTRPVSESDTKTKFWTVSYSEWLGPPFRELFSQ